MGINKAMYNGVNAIMDAYDRNAQTPYYSVWAGKDMIFSYNEDDQEQGRVHLMENLIACEQNEHSDILKIKFHPKKEKTFITDKTPAIATLFVRVCDPNYLKGQVQPYNAQPNYGLQSLLERQTEILSGLSNRMSALEEAQIQEEEEYEEEEEDTLGKVGTILNHPAIQTILGILMPQVLPVLKAQPAPQPTVAGVQDDLTVIDEEVGDTFDVEAVGEINYNLIDEALERLSKHTPTLAKDLNALADMADNNPMQFKMLLGMLKK
jgi:hypothetical protein